MITAFLIVSLFCLIDLFLLYGMPKFYFYLGIPFYRGTIPVKPNITLRDIGAFIGLSEKLIYKFKKDSLVFRTKFSYSTLYRITFLSIIKGDVKVENGNAHFVLRINLTTIYFALLLIYTFVTQKIDLLGYILALVVLVIGVLLHMSRIAEIQFVMKDILVNCNQEKKVKSRWGD